MCAESSFVKMRDLLLQSLTTIDSPIPPAVCLIGQCDLRTASFQQVGFCFNCFLYLANPAAESRSAGYAFCYCFLFVYI